LRLDYEVVDNESKVPIYKWIEEREGNPEINGYDVVEDRFPDGPQRGFIDIVVLTEESAYWPVCFSWSN